MADRPRTETPDVWRDRRRHDLERQVADIHDMLTEQLGRDGNGGLIWKQFSEISDSRKSQGKRLGDVEGKVSSLTVWKAQVVVVGILVFTLFGAFSKELMAKLFGQ